MQKGSAQIIAILMVIVLILLGVIYFSQKLTKNDLQISPQVNSKVETISTHTDQDLGFELKYPKGMTLKLDTEEEFNKRGNGNFRKNFTYYVTYPPAKVLGAAVVLDEGASYEMSPFTVWVFENPNDLTIDKWYLNFWYYPFVWGDYTARRNNVAPEKEATISGQIAKFGVVTYQPGSPKFLYLKNNNKMYLIRIINNEEKFDDQILSTFKFLQ